MGIDDMQGIVFLKYQTIKATKPLWNSSVKDSMQATAGIFANKENNLRPPVIYGAPAAVVGDIGLPVAENKKKLML